MERMPHADAGAADVDWQDSPDDAREYTLSAQGDMNLVEGVRRYAPVRASPAECMRARAGRAP